MIDWISVTTYEENQPLHMFVIQCKQKASTESTIREIQKKDAHLFRAEDTKSKWGAAGKPSNRLTTTTNLRQWRAEGGANGTPAPGIHSRGASKKWNHKNKML